MAALAYVPDGLLGLRDLLHTFVDLAKERLVLSEPLKGRCHDPLHSSVAVPPGTGTSQTPLGPSVRSGEKRRSAEGGAPDPATVAAKETRRAAWRGFGGSKKPVRLGDAAIPRAGDAARRWKCCSPTSVAR